MPAPVCVPCKKFYQCKKNEFHWAEGKPVGDVPIWVPYKIWNSDLWECPKCGHQIVVGHALRPVSEKYMENFDEYRGRLNTNLVIEDC